MTDSRQTTETLIAATARSDDAIEPTPEPDGLDAAVAKFRLAPTALFGVHVYTPRQVAPLLRLLHEVNADRAAHRRRALRWQRDAEAWAQAFVEVRLKRKAIAAGSEAHNG